METRANFILIGSFTLLAILGTLGFFIWLASVQIDRQYATYGILFDDVSGLDPSGDVLFNGISVGQVIGLRIYEEDPSKVFTTIEIDATTPVRTNTVAQLQSQGVTGVAYISLSGGTTGAAPLTSDDENPPIIPSRRSTVQSLVEDAPDLLIETTRLLQQFQALTGPENQDYITNILRNLDRSSGQLDQAMSDFSSISATVSDATAQITRFTERLDSIGASVATTLGRTDAALASADRTLRSAETAFATSLPVIQSIERTFGHVEQVLREEIPTILAQVSETLNGTEAAVADIQERSGRALDGFDRTAGLLNARLGELEKTLLDANAAFAAVTEASDSFDILVDGDGTMLVAEVRAVVLDAKRAIATIEAVVLDDLPEITGGLRAAVATASGAVDRVASDLTGLTGRLDPLADEAQAALVSATTVLEASRTTLGRLETTLGRADGALNSAETAFEAATGVLRTDLGPVLGDIRIASDRISRTVEDVTRDLPAIATDLRALIARADATVAGIQGAVAAATPGIGDFARTGLPELTRLSGEARSLVAALDSLVRRIERDPARFLLDERVPEYRR